jgi:hypothetical protein
MVSPSPAAKFAPPGGCRAGRVVRQGWGAAQAARVRVRGGVSVGQQGDLLAYFVPEANRRHDGCQRPYGGDWEPAGSFRLSTPT